MTTILAIDPGNTESAYVVIDEDRRPIQFGKVENTALQRLILGIRGSITDPIDTKPLAFDRAAIEMVASYGMPVGRDVFETCVWIGRHAETIRSRGVVADLVYRQPVKLHHCGSARAKDANVTQALVDRFTPGQPNKGKGTKAEPGWFHGFAKDVWQAYALAVYVADTEPLAVT